MTTAIFVVSLVLLVDVVMLAAFLMYDDSQPATWVAPKWFDRVIGGVFLSSVTLAIALTILGIVQGP